MAKEKKIVYTSIPRYLKLSNNIIVEDYRSLSIYEWARKRIESMCNEESSYAEERFMNMCRAFKHSLFRQVFFRIDGRCYFLDFFLVELNMAIEIDGSYHKNAEVSQRDKERDSAFLSIGIRTVRFTTDQLRDTDFKTKYFLPALKSFGKKPGCKQDETSHQTRILHLVEKLNYCNMHDIIEVRSNYTSFLRAISRLDAPSDKAKDKALLAKFYDKKRELNLVILPRFIGTTQKMKKREKKWMENLERECSRRKANRIFEI